MHNKIDSVCGHVHLVAKCSMRLGNKKRGKCTKNEVKKTTCDVAQCKVSPCTPDSNLAHASFDLAQ